MKQKQNYETEQELKIEIGEKDNRPKGIIYIDRLLWITMTILIIYLTFFHTKCKIITNQLGEQACMTKNQICQLEPIPTLKDYTTTDNIFKNITTKVRT